MSHDCLAERKGRRFQSKSEFGFQESKQVFKKNWE